MPTVSVRIFALSLIEMPDVDCTIEWPQQQQPLQHPLSLAFTFFQIRAYFSPSKIVFNPDSEILVTPVGAFNIKLPAKSNAELCVSFRL